MKDAVQIYVTLAASADALAEWEPEKVAAFFAGIAKVFAAERAAPVEGPK